VEEEVSIRAVTTTAAAVAYVEPTSFWDSQEFFLVGMVATVLGISLGTFLIVNLLR